MSCSTEPRPFSLKDLLISVLLLVAAFHCVQSIFIVNISVVNLREYGLGQARTPFQGRVAMVPIVRWSGGNARLQRASDFLQHRIFKGRNRPTELFSAEKVACMAVGLIATWAAVIFAIFFGRRHLADLWWLPASFFVFMLYVTYAARCENQYWYPYDLPHFALFGIAAVFILQGSWAAAFCVFLVDLPTRETSIYLVPLMLAVGYLRRQRRVIPWAAVMAALWLVVRITISRHFAGNASDTRVHLDVWMHIAREPWVWPQLASAFGFLLIPFCFGFRLLTKEERFFVYAAFPGVVCTLLFSVWYETRVFDEWLLPIAVLMSFQVSRLLEAKQVRTADEVASSGPLFPSEANLYTESLSVT